MRRKILALVFILTLAFPFPAHADGPSHVVAYGETLYSIARKYGVTPQALANANGITTRSWVYAGQRLMIPGSGGGTSAAPEAAAQVSPSGIYLVRAGDTLYSVSRQFGVPVQTIAAANDIPPNGFLYTGWQLKIPGAANAVQNGPAPAQSNSPQNNAPVPANSNSPQNNAPQNNAPVPAQNNAAQNNAPAPSNAAQPAIRASDLAISYIVQPGDTLYGIAIRKGVTIQAIVIANNLPAQFIFSGQRLTIPGAASNSTQANNATNAPASSVSIPGGFNLVVAAVPLYRQKQTLTCEEAAVAMATFGALSEEQIVGAMDVSDNPFEGIRGDTNFELLGGLTHYGTYAQALQKGLAKLGRQSTTYYGQPYENFRTSILQNLREGRPVVWWTTWRESHQTPQAVTLANGKKIALTPYEHSVLIIAASDNGVTYHDPYDGSVRFTTWVNHERTSGYFNNMALVVY